MNIFKKIGKKTLLRWEYLNKVDAEKSSAVSRVVVQRLAMDFESKLKDAAVTNVGAWKIFRESAKAEKKAHKELMQVVREEYERHGGKKQKTTAPLQQTQQAAA